MKIIITGICGLIGSNFACWLSKNKKDVSIIGIDNLSGGYIENIDTEKIEFFNINLTEYEKVENIFKNNKITYIFHLAAYAAEGLSPFLRKFNYTNNLLVTTNLVNMAIKYNVKRFIFTSSMATYGFSDGKLPFTEESPQIPIDPYGIAKLACEKDIIVAQQQHGLEFCIIRPHNVYGKKQNIWDKYRNVLGIWMYLLLNDKKITIYGDGNQTRAFSYIDDILEPLWNSAIYEKAKNQVVNLGGIHQIKLNDAANILLDIAKTGEKVYLEERHEVKHAYSSYQKSIDILDFEMKTSLKEGLKKMWNWAKIQKNRERKEWSNFELTNGIYSYWKKT